MNEAGVEGNGIALTYLRHCQGFVEAKEVKRLLELATETLFSKEAVSA